MARNRASRTGLRNAEKRPVAAMRTARLRPINKKRKNGEDGVLAVI
jgi:hypothetical protein